ncbi:MAG: hypothetical protein FWF87_06880 [Synergistaceae bacterium]|nr:hypothetical protein [Synergistaceae bacterium]
MTLNDEDREEMEEAILEARNFLCITKKFITDFQLIQEKKKHSAGVEDFNDET